jgi:ankyrin repeat protein
MVRDLLKKNDVDTDARNIFDDGWTALHYAIHEGCFSIVKLLIEEFDANIESRTIYNKTPLHFACRKNDDSII